MVTIKEINVTDQFGTDSLYITFRITDTYDDLNNYVFNLYKSFNRANGYTLLATDIKNFTYRDRAVNLYNPALNYYYKVEVQNRSNPSESTMSDCGEYKGQKPDNEAATLTEIYRSYLANAIRNEPMRLLKKIHYGQLCQCFDEVRNRPDPMGCTICYGAKYKGGYYPPELVNVCYLNAASKSKTFNVAEDSEEDSPIQVWTANIPLIQNEDILVDRNNVRYIVSAWQPSYKNSYLLRQTFQMQRVPKSSIVYKIPVEG